MFLVFQEKQVSYCICEGPVEGEKRRRSTPKKKYKSKIKTEQRWNLHLVKETINEKWILKTVGRNTLIGNLKCKKN